MSTSRRVPVVPLAAILTVLSLAAAPRPAAAAGPRPIQRAYEGFAPIADSLARLEPGRAYARADSVIAFAGSRHDIALEAAARLWRGSRAATNDYDLARGEPDLTAALAAARALRDTFALALAHSRRAFGFQLAGRSADAARDYAEAARLARRAGLAEIEGLSHRGLGFIAKNAGEYEQARTELTRALRLLPEDSFAWLHARFLRGEVLNRTGHRDQARVEFEGVLAEAARRRNRWLTAAARNDLGIVAFEQGDMAAADREWEAAAAQFDTLALDNADRGGAINARINRAHALILLGRLDEARALLEHQADLSDQIEDPTIRIGVLGELGALLRRSGRVDASERMLRAVRAAAAGDDAAAEEAASIELAGLLRGSGRLAEAGALLDSLLAPARSARLTPDDAGAALVERSAVLRAMGRMPAAVAAAREAERLTRSPAGPVSIYWLDAATELGRAQRAAGRPDSAVVLLARAARAWERWRAGISDLEWRERAGSGLSGLFSEYGLALLDARRGGTESGRARAAFDALQVFQARTLEERMQGAGLAGRAMARRVTADSLQQRVLRADEVLLDLVALPETTLAFAVTRDAIVVRRLGGTLRLDPLFNDWRGAMLNGAPAAVVERGLARLSAELLGPLSTELAGSRRLIVTGGGPVLLWPIGALTIPGRDSPLDETHEVVTAPSATLFALLRARGTQSAEARDLLAMGRTTDPAGHELPGAERELEMLERSFGQVTLRRNHGERRVPEMTSNLGHFGAIHVAAHASAPAAAPWRSGFLLGRGAGEDAWLRASTVARWKLRARLAVLSGCQSAGGGALAGEGVQGLSSGFLCAGTTTVVATLWPVADRTAELYMTAFYAALARRQSAAAAARAASQALRAGRETSNPRDWAAFVVVGEPATRLLLPARRPF